MTKSFPIMEELAAYQSECARDFSAPGSVEYRMTPDRWALFCAELATKYGWQVSPASEGRVTMMGPRGPWIIRAW